MSYTNYAPEISKWSQDFLRDRAVAWPLDGVTPECKASQHCESYLLAMPYQSIFPWPFAPGLAKDDVDSLSLSSASYYQIDMWDPVQKNESLTDVKPFDLQLDCDKYGTWDHLSIMLCMEMYAPKKYYSIGKSVALTSSTGVSKS